MDSKSSIQHAAAVFKALGEPTRLQIVQLLAENQSLSCQEMMDILHVPSSTLSHHLKQLRECGVIELHKKGKYHCHSVSTDILQRYTSMF